MTAEIAVKLLERLADGQDRINGLAIEFDETFFTFAPELDSILEDVNHYLQLASEGKMTAQEHVELVRNLLSKAQKFHKSFCDNDFQLPGKVVNTPFKPAF